MIHSEFSKPHPRIGRDTAQATFRQVNATLGGTRPSGFNWEGEQLHDFVLFAVNTGLRPDEAWRLEFRDVTVADDEDLGKTILEIEVRGKRGVGYCKSMPGAVRPFERLRSRLRPARIYGVNTPEKSSVTMPAIGTSASGTNIWDGPNKPLSRFGVATCPSRRFSSKWITSECHSTRILTCQFRW